MSFGNEWTEIQLDKTQTTLVMGKNGSGKSSGILDTISFALFNKPFRNITKPQLTNSISGKHTLVELDFLANGHQLQVRRGQKPNIFEIFKDGELINQTADNRDYQDAFEKYILKVNHKTFCQVVMLGSAIFTPFMALPTPARRAVIEDLLDLEIFTKMNVLLSGKVKEAEKEFIKYDKEKNVLNEREKLLEEQLKKDRADRKALIETKYDEYKKTQDELLSSQHHRVRVADEIQHLNEYIQHHSLVVNRQSKLTKLKHQIEHKHNQVEKEIKFFQDHEVCPTCTQEISEEFKDKTVLDKNNIQSDLKVGIQQLEDESRKVEEQLSDISDVLEQIQHFNGEVRAIDENIKMYIGRSKQLRKEIEKLEEPSDDKNVEKLEETKRELVAINREVDKFLSQKQVMGYASTFLKDSGIKAKIIKTFVPVINKLINKYLASLDFFVEFSLDEEFKEKLLSRFRDEFSYESFSEGEKMRLNIAILFAWRALAKLRGSIDCNLVILDELLDSSLDDDGLQDVIKLLQNLTSGENVFIISHKDNLQEKFNRVLRFEKKTNFSRLKK